MLRPRQQKRFPNACPLSNSNVSGGGESSPPGRDIGNGFRCRSQGGNSQQTGVLDGSGGELTPLTQTLETVSNVAAGGGTFPPLQRHLNWREDRRSETVFVAVAKGTFAFSLLVEALERERGQALGNCFRCRSGPREHLPSLRDIGIGRRQAFGQRFCCSCLGHSVPQTLEMRRGQAFRNSFCCHALGYVHVSQRR